MSSRKNPTCQLFATLCGSSISCPAVHKQVESVLLHWGELEFRNIFCSRRCLEAESSHMEEVYITSSPPRLHLDQFLAQRTTFICACLVNQVIRTTPYILW